MENQKINQLLAELNENLKLNCCAKEITPQLIIDPKKSLFVNYMTLFVMLAMKP